MQVPTRREAKTQAFSFRELRAQVQLSRGLLLDIATSCIKGQQGDTNKAITRLGFQCAELSNHPDRIENVVGKSFSFTEIGEETVLLSLNVSLLPELHDLLIMSPNTAVAALGYQCGNLHSQCLNNGEGE